MLSRLREYRIIIFMGLPTDVPPQLSKRASAGRNLKLRARWRWILSCVFLVISRPLYLQAKLNPKTPTMALPLVSTDFTT